MRNALIFAAGILTGLALPLIVVLLVFEL